VETRLTLRPGRSGTRKLVARCGERLVCVRYLYDRAAGRRDDDIVAVTIAWGEPHLRERAKRLGAIGRPGAKIWEMRWADTRRPGIADRVKEA
jgi:hypothetical protein